MMEWKSIAGYEGYQVSNTGDVRNANGQVLKPCAGASGYLTLHLYRNGHRSTVYVHRIVAEAFCPHDESLHEVNHKDGDKQNNHASNLEWCTRKDNLLHSYYVLKQHVKAVKCIETGIVYPSIHEAARQTGMHRSAIALCCDGRQKKTRGFHWGYAV